MRCCEGRAGDGGRDVDVGRWGCEGGGKEGGGGESGWGERGRVRKEAAARQGNLLAFVGRGRAGPGTMWNWVCEGVWDSEYENVLLVKEPPTRCEHAQSSILK